MPLFPWVAILVFLACGAAAIGDTEAPDLASLAAKRASTTASTLTSNNAVFVHGLSVVLTAQASTAAVVSSLHTNAGGAQAAKSATNAAAKSAQSTTVSSMGTSSNQVTSSNAATSSSSSAQAAETTSASTNAANGVNLSSQSTSLSTLLSTSATSGTSSDAVLTTVVTSATNTGSSTLASSASALTTADVASSSTGSSTAVAARGTLSSAQTTLSTGTSQGVVSTSSAATRASSQSTVIVSETSAAASLGSTSSLAATGRATSGATMASTTGGVLHKPQKCSPYILCTLEGAGLSHPNPVFYGFWEQSLHGVTDLNIAYANVNRGTSYGDTVFSSLPNQQLNGLECDFFQSSMMWDVASGFCSGYAQTLQPIGGESEFVSDAMYCVSNAVLMTTSAVPIQIFWTHQVGNTYQIVRVENSSITSDYNQRPIVTLPVGSGGVVELVRYRLHILAQAYMNLACSLTYTSGLRFLTNYTTSSVDPWESVGVVCIHNADATNTANHNYFQLVDAGNHYNLTVTAHAATSGGVAGGPLVLASLQKNFGDPEETVTFGHSLQVLAIGAMCAYRGRFVMSCNDCRL